MMVIGFCFIGGILVYLLTSLLHIVTFDGTSTEVLQDGRDFFYKNGPLQLLEIQYNSQIVASTNKSGDAAAKKTDLMNIR